jgi:spermidine synthase
VESAYQCLRVDESEPLDGHPVRTLYLDNLPHADVAIDQPLLLAHDYLVPAAEMAGYVASRERPLRALVIGGGGYSLPRYLAAAYPDAEITVLELDPAVTAMARARLNLSLSPPFGIVHGDARETLETLPPDRRYDLIVLDAFSDVMVPYHLVTAEIDRRIAARLAPDGRYVALVHDLPLGRLLPAATRTMREVFGAVDVLAAGPGVGWRRPVRRTWSVVAGATELDAERIDALTHPTPNGPFPILSEVMPSELLDDLLRRPGPARLTDDYTPVEVLAAPLFD